MLELLPYVPAMLVFIIMLLILGWWLIVRLKHCPSDKILVIHVKDRGLVALEVLFVLFLRVVHLVFVILGRKAHRSAPHAPDVRWYHGGWHFVWPLMEDCTWLSLEPIPVDLSVKNACSGDEVPLIINGSFTVAIGTEPQIMQNAVMNFLGSSIRGEDGITQIASDIMRPQVRKVAGSLSWHELATHQEELLPRLHQALQPDLERTGLVLININITSIKQEQLSSATS